VTYRQIGTVIEAFRMSHQAKYDSIMREFAGRAAIGRLQEILDAIGIKTAVTPRARTRNLSKTDMLGRAAARLRLNPDQSLHP
jgi:hypothetical protein